MSSGASDAPSPTMTRPSAGDTRLRSPALPGFMIAPPTRNADFPLRRSAHGLDGSAGLIGANIGSSSSSSPGIRGRPGGGKPQQICRQLADHDLKSNRSAASPAPSRPPPYDGGGGRPAKLAPMSAGLRTR